MNLYPYQSQCVDYALKHRYSLNGCEMGLGKSAIALEFIKRAGRQGLIVGPAFLEGTWKQEAEKWGVSKSIRFVSYSQIHKLTLKDVPQYGVWVADEVHYLKNPKAIRTNAYYGLLKAARPDFWLGLSGTILKNQVSDLWVPLAICSQCPEKVNGLHLEGDLQKFRQFQHYFCNVEIFKMRGVRIERFSGVKTSRIPELKAFLKDKYIKFRVEDVLKDLPSMTTVNVDLQLSRVPGLEEAFDAYMSGSKVDPTSKAASAHLKANHTAEYVANILEQGESVLVFSDHIASSQAIAAKLKGSVCITGAVSSDTRHNLVTRFQSGEIKVIVATIGSLSTGVTLTAARHVVFNDLSWSPSENTQASKRIHRIGQKDVCFKHIMVASPTDAYIAKTLLVKEETIMKVLGD